jgi:Tfp pilus assembly protein PilF
VTTVAQRRPSLPDLAGGASVILAVALLALGRSRMNAGRYAEAARLLADGLEVGQRAVGPEHPSLIQPLLMLADCFQRTARTDAADALYRRAAKLAGCPTVDRVTVDAARGRAGSAVAGAR